MDKRIFNYLQKQGLAELKNSIVKDAWWQQGPRYTLQLHHGSGATRVYEASITVKGKIPTKVQYEDGEYTLDFKTIEERDFPMHFVPYVKFERKQKGA